MIHPISSKSNSQATMGHQALDNSYRLLLNHLGQKTNGFY